MRVLLIPELLGNQLAKPVAESLLRLVNSGFVHRKFLRDALDRSARKRRLEHRRGLVLGFLAVPLHGKPVMVLDPLALECLLRIRVGVRAGGGPGCLDGYRLSVVALTREKVG